MMGVGAENRTENKFAGGDEELELRLAVPAGVEVPKRPATGEPHAAGPRGTWTRRVEFVLASVGYAVGLGNVWRFPYLCYRSGGGAFLLPYLLMLFVCGIPLLFMEFTVGVGLATVVISYVLCTYYNVLMTWALYYLLHSFSRPPPWHSCNNTWNQMHNCSTGLPANATHLQSASQQFFDRKVLEMTSGIEQLGGIRWELLGLLFLCWAIVYFCIFKGVKSTGKVVYFTATFPYLVLFALLINNVQLPGARDGILFFLTPNWSRLLEVQVWVSAASQIFNSIGIAFGSMISMASYNKFNNNILRDTFIVCLANSATSILAGFVIFSAIGYMAHLHHLPVDDIATEGPGLVFVVYPEVLSTMPVSQLWAPLFFIMLLCLGLDSQFAMVEVAVTFIVDEFGQKLLPVLKRKEMMVLSVCVCSFLLGIPHITRGGIYVFHLVDHYTAEVSLMFLAFFEVFSVTVVFGVRRLSVMVEQMLGRRPHFLFRLCWQFLSPMLVLGILVSHCVRYSPARYGKFYTYPLWAEVLGWFISLVSIIWIPLGALHQLCSTEGSLLQRLKVSITPLVDLEPVSDKHSAENIL